MLSHTLLVSLAKNTAPFPIPKVPFIFFPFLSTSDTDHVWISSAVTFVDATLSAGSTYVLTGRGGYIASYDAEYPETSPGRTDGGIMICGGAACSPSSASSLHAST